MFGSKCNGPTINHMAMIPATTAFFIQRRKKGIFFCGVEGCCILSAARQTPKEGGGEWVKMCKGG